MRKINLKLKNISTQRKIFILLMAMTIGVFILVGQPNGVASNNLSMVQMFEPDEAVQLPVVLDMIEPAPSLNQALRNFIFYEYYFYGFPFFGLSALVLLPLKWLGMLDNIPLVMLVLRQMISVLPSLLALLFLVFMQDRFRTYRSPLMFALLISIPAVLQNNFWWHPDGIIFLMAVLVIFFLRRDNLSFGWNFLFAAAMCGIATATKLIGVYFFLAVGVTLIAGLVLKKASLKKLIRMALLFLVVMTISFIAANPFLLSHWARTAYRSTFNIQLDVLSSGYGILYEKGLPGAWPIIHKYYGEAVFLVIALAATIWGLWKGPRRGLYGLILSWFLPVSVVVIWVTHFKFQYWLPVAIPLISCLIIAFPGKMKFDRASITANLTRLTVLAVILVQLVLFVNNDRMVFMDRLHRADNNPRIQFYDQVLTSLDLFKAMPLDIYYDYRMYMPNNADWDLGTNYDLLDYDYIQKKNFDALLLLRQRIRDYLNPNASGVDPDAFFNNQKFYRDAESGTIQNYHLLYGDEVGLIFIKDDLYNEYFNP
jgi:hypothetical protein